MSASKWGHSPQDTYDEILKKGRPILPPMSPGTAEKKEQLQTSTNIKYISNNLPIEVSPPEIIISDIEPNQTYEVVLLVRNLTNIGRRIRVYQPKTNKFRCDYDMQGNIAAGLAMKLVLSFETDKLGDFHDVLEIVSDEKFSVTVPLHAYQPQASVVFDPFVNFGFIKINKEENRPVLFENQGKKEGRIDLRFDGIHDMSIVPSNFVIKAGERKEVMIRYTPKEAGIFRGTIEVTVEGQSLLKHIDVSATSVDYFIFMVDQNGGQTHTFDFGDIYFGQFREIEGYLVNNSPQRFNFKAKFLTGMQNNAGDMFSIQTPYDLGQEQIQRIMTCYPEEGVIDSYSQVPVKFSCKSRVTDDMIFWTRNYCMKKERPELDRGSEYDVTDHGFEPTNYSYTCIFEFDGKSDLSPYIHLSAKGICPTVKLSHHLVNFGECQVNDRRDYLLTLENKNMEQPVDFSFSNVAHFKVAPKKGKALPHSSQSVTVAFEPKSLGKFTTSIDLELFGTYKIPIKVMGSALSLSPTKKMTKRGPDSLPEDFSPNRKFVTDDNIDYAQRRIKKDNRTIFMSPQSTGSSPDKFSRMDATNASENLQIYNTIKSNKDKYNTYLEEQKLKRLNAPKELERKQKIEMSNDKLEQMLPNREFWATRDKEDNQVVHPFDFDFIFGTEPNPLDKPKYALPDPHDPLFVVKPVGRYEPTSGGKSTDFRPDPTKPSKKIFPSEAQSQAELRDIERELSAEDLQKIYVGPTTIDFGSVFVKSRATRYFAVKNQLKTAIVVQLLCTSNELAESNQRPQVIPPMQTAGFEVVFYSHNLQSFKGAVKYIINNKHEFAFATHAQVEPVKLVLETTNLPFKFQEKDEDMELTNTLTIINKGNAPGNFKWDVAPTSVFKVNPIRGFVPAEGNLKISITYIPSGVNFRGESERIAMQVENGETQYLNLIGFVNEARCEFREEMVDFGNVLVSQENPKAVVLKNKHKSVAVFKVNPVLPPGITVQPLGGKIGADSHVELRVAVCSNEERVINDEILVNIRGGKQVKLPVKAKVIVPKIRIAEEDFDFGGVTYGSTATLNMTIVNESEISAVLNLDLSNENENPGIQFLEVQPASEPGEDESSFIMSVNQENNPQEHDNEPSLSMTDSDEEEPEKEKMRNFNIKIKEKSTLNFIIKFTPSEAKNFNFELPIKLQGYGKIDTLTRFVSCRGLRPRCIIDPPFLEFKKKTINGFDKPIPDHERVVISNIDQTKTITWRLDTRSIDEDRTFTLSPSSGKIEPGQQQVVTIGFSPVNPGQYEKMVPLFIDNDNTKPYAQLTLKGLGDFPRLLFEKREIVMPIVPLEVESRCTFRIINDGYENLTLKYEISNDVGNIGKDYLKLEFPEGKQLGVTKSKLKVDAVFKSKKPLSFTVELVFVDDSKHFYRLMISGTTDNSLFTNYSYLQRNFGEFEINAPEGKPLYLKELDNDDSDTSPKAFSVGVSKSGSMNSRAGKSLLGYTPIPQRELEKACENIRNWLNQNVLASYISKFPNEIIESNGSQLFDLVQYLTGKSPAARANLNLVTKKTERVKLLHKQYDDLIKVLKENGCLLNTIRPEYLFRHSDYNTYIKLQDNQFLTPNTLKLSEGKFLYVSIDAWITIIYQILKVYYLGRVTLKSFRNTPGMPPENLNVPEYYLEGSNLISVSENLLLRWLEVHYEKMKPGNKRRIRNFGDDLRDGHIFSAVIQSYVGTNASKALAVLRNNPQNKDDYIYNAGKIITALEELGLQSPFVAKDIETPSQREMILLCLYLYNNLPHYIPKATIEFAGMLRDSVVKHVELKNMSNKGISYRVRLEGDADFSLEGTEERESTVYVEPKNFVMFPIKYTARLSKTMTGRVLFTNKREEGNVPAAALVFELKSKVTGRRSEATEVFQSRLYEQKIREIRVENSFNQKADFQVEFIYQKPAPSPEKKNRSLGGSNKKRSPRKTDQPQIDDAFQPFASKIMTLTVPRQGAATIPVSFIPFTMETHTCHLVLRDDKVGEIQYTLVGEVELPPPIELPTAGTFYLDNEIKFQVNINVNNHLLQAARKSHIERLPQSQRAKEMEKEKNVKLIEKSFDTVIFNVESLSQFLNLPTTFTLHNAPGKQPTKPLEVERKGNSTTLSAATTKKKLENSFDSKANDVMSNASMIGTSENKLPVNLSINVPTKDQPMRFIFRSQNKVDIRLYEIRVSVLPRPVKAILEMRCAAGETLKQDIPIKNDSDRDWMIKANLSIDGKNGHCFSGGKDFRVPRNSTAAYSIQFKPQWVMTAEAKLTLSNQFNGMQYEFELRGIGEDPVAEGHIVLECKARKTKQHIFRIKNEYDRKMTYKVETDLYNASGKSTFELAPGRTEDYVLDVTPMLGGAYTGSITFIDETNKYKWWTVEVHTESPKPEKSIDLVTTIRKAIAFDISISNPLDEHAVFEVLLTGDGLIGDNTFNLAPKQTGMYELVFSPLRSFKQIGSLAFIHEKLGELCYELNLQADEPQPIRLSTIKAELGKSGSHEVELENPSGREVHVRKRLSNPHNFDVSPDDIVIPPYDSTIVQIIYNPSDLDIMESCEVLFETEEIGKWTYLAFGQGIPPTKFELQTVSGSLNRDSSAMINFRNPFKDPITVTIALEADDESKSVFEILIKKTKMTIGGLNVVQIPLSFLPRAISDYYAALVITMNEKISWRYPLKGVTESYSTASDFVLKTKCRVRYENELKFVLPGNPNVAPDEHYTLELINIPKEYEKILQNPNHKALVFTTIKDKLRSPEDQLTFKAVFQPLKPFKAGIDIAIVKSTGGRWKYKLYLEATSPEADDNITITSNINNTSSISFKLANYIKHPAEFHAAFTPDSDSEFIVMPKSGLLEPYGKDGTTFVISFTPVEYGKIKIGKLVVQTEEMYWSYNLKGVLPKYVVPKINSTRIENKLSEDIKKKLGGSQAKRNFMLENIKKSSQSPVKKGVRAPSKSRSRSRSPGNE